MKNSCAFLRKYFNEMRYLENTPMDSNQFLKYCQELGLQLSVEQLESFEKEKLFFPIFRLSRPRRETEWIYFKKNGDSLKRPKSYGILDGKVFIDEKTEVDYFRPTTFRPDTHEQWLSLFENGHISSPDNEEFRPWEEFLKSSNKIVDSFYASYQALWVSYIQDHSTSLNLDIRFKDSLILDTNGDLLIKGFKKTMEIDTDHIQNKQVEFTQFLHFLLLVQAKYHPVYQSGAGYVTMTSYDQDISRKIAGICPKKDSDFIGISLDTICKFYSKFCRKADMLLGQGAKNDWLQLWKNISWEKKRVLKGQVRLGIEHLQIATMTKKILEDITHKKMPDIDEVMDIAHEDILTICANLNPSLYRTSYSIRLDRYSEKPEDGLYYNDDYKRRYYLANDFGYGYHPSMILFVEGKSEQVVLPIICEAFFSISWASLSIHIVNLGGTEAFFGTTLNVKDNGKYKKKVSSDFRNLIRCYIEQWQVIPFLCTDKENGLPDQLKSGVITEHGGKSYSFPEEWIFIWGQNQATDTLIDKDSLQGNSFELANFYNDELCKALKEVHNVDITPETIEDLRRNGHSLNQLNLDSIALDKIKVCTYLANGLFSSNKNHQSRPVYALLSKVIEIAKPWGRAIDRKHEIVNQDYILRKLVPR